MWNFLSPVMAKWILFLLFFNLFVYNWIYPKNFLCNKFPKKPNAYIKHFYTKTVEEFCNKINKGNAHFHSNHSKYRIITNSRIKLFFIINKYSKEKLNILENCTKIKLNIFK